MDDANPHPQANVVAMSICRAATGALVGLVVLNAAFDSDWFMVTLIVVGPATLTGAAAASVVGYQYKMSPGTVLIAGILSSPAVALFTSTLLHAGQR